MRRAGTSLDLLALPMGFSRAEDAALTADSCIVKERIVPALVKSRRKSRSGV
jgi:hypothetical protein